MLCCESLKSLKNMPSNHSCPPGKVFPVKSFFSYSERDKGGQWGKRRSSSCVSAYTGRDSILFAFPFFSFLSWHQLVYRNIQQIPTGDSLLLTGHRKNNNHLLCIFHWSVVPVPDSRLGCLPPSIRWDPGQGWGSWNSERLSLQWLKRSSFKPQREQWQSYLLLFVMGRGSSCICFTHCQLPLG